MGLLSGIVGSVFGPKQTGTATTTNNSTTQTTLDPAIQSLIFGSNGSGGLLSQFSSLLNKPQDAGMAAFGQAAQNYLGNYGANDFSDIRNTATRLQNGNSAPTVSNPLWNTATTVNAPAQNNIDLTSSYQNLLSGGDTSKLMSSLQAGNALTNQQLAQNQASLTDNFLKNVLPATRGGAIAAGQFGSSRQGIAEGNAISDLNKQLSDSATQVGLANSANNANALAANYENGQNRALAATQGLGAQQYGVAQQNAQLDQASQLANQQVGNNYNFANQQAQLTTNGQNNSAAAAGGGLLGGMLGQLYGVGQNQNNYQLSQYQGINSLLAPYLNANATTTTKSTATQPIYSNPASSLLGGLGLFSGLLGGGSGSTALSQLQNTPSSVAGYSPALTMPNVSLPSYY